MKINFSDTISDNALHNAILDYKNKIDINAAYGILGHPDTSYDISKNISHRIIGINKRIPRKLKKKLKKLGKYKKEISAEIELLNTCEGKTALSIIDNLYLGVRGYGDVGNNGRIYNYKIMSIDLLSK